MEENGSKKFSDEISVQTTVELLDYFGRKRQYFEEIIGKLKKFQPTSISPNVNTNKSRASPRLTTPKSDNEKALDQFDISVILNQMKYLFDTNMQFITIDKDLHSKYDIIKNNNFEIIKSNDNFKIEMNKIQKEIKTVNDED